MPRLNHRLTLAVMCLAGCQGGTTSDAPGAAAPTADAPAAVPTAGSAESIAAPPEGSLPKEWLALLEARQIDYTMALRSASLELVGAAPTLADVKGVRDAADPRVAYEAAVDRYLADSRFVRQQMAYWRDTFKFGGSKKMTVNGTDTTVDYDAPSAFATLLATTDRSLLELFTATTGNCATYADATAQVTAADCANGVTTHAGVLTNPGVMSFYMSNLAFRRVRWIQETFACNKFPAPQEIGPPVPLPDDSPTTLPYVGKWPFTSIAGALTTLPAGTQAPRVNFHDRAAVVCANCHQSLNHIAPLFARFDAVGNLVANIQVRVPVQGTPAARAQDWLPPNEPTAWRMGAPAADIPALGKAMAADPDVIKCLVDRYWNRFMSKGDIVATLQPVPPDVASAAKILADFIAGGFKVKPMLRAIVTSDDFVRF